MGRHKKPFDQLDASGAFIRDPKKKKARQSDAAPVGTLGNPPGRLTKLEKKLWKQEAARVPAGIAGTKDRSQFELYIRHLAMSHGDLQVMRVGDKNLLVSLQAKFRLSPASQITVAAPQQSRLAAFLSRGTDVGAKFDERRAQENKGNPTTAPEAVN